MNSDLRLSHRLERLLQLLQTGERLWDIGCDHGQVGRSAGERGLFKEVCFVDPAPLVINTLKHLIDSDIPTRYSYKIFQQKADQIQLSSLQNSFLLAGFGGIQMVEGLQHLYPQLKAPSRIVLSAHRHNLALRNYLHHNDWSLITEEILQENDQYYEAIVIQNGPGPRVSLYGEAQWTTSMGEARRQDLLKKLPIHRNPVDQAFLGHLLSLGKT